MMTCYLFPVISRIAPYTTASDFIVTLQGVSQSPFKTFFQEFPEPLTNP